MERGLKRLQIEGVDVIALFHELGTANPKP
jgi:hypothetical protein